MKCNTRSGRIIREETRKERLTRPSNFAISTIRRPHTDVYLYTTTYRVSLQDQSYFGLLRQSKSFLGRKLLHMSRLSY
jgi:hypothetical protein